jgi:hypothetical protein
MSESKPTECSFCSGVLTGEAEKYYLGRDWDLQDEDEDESRRQRAIVLGLTGRIEVASSQEEWRRVAAGHLNSCDWLSYEAQDAGLEYIWADELLGLVEPYNDSYPEKVDDRVITILSEKAARDIEESFESGDLDFDTESGPEFEYAYELGQEVRMCQTCGHVCPVRTKQEGGS